MVMAYVIPSNGISTARALTAFLYCWISRVLAERSLVTSTTMIEIIKKMLTNTTRTVGAWKIQSISLSRNQLHFKRIKNVITLFFPII